MTNNPYLPQPVELISITPQTRTDATYRLSWPGEMPQPGQFFEVSIPRVGEAPISVCDFGAGYIDMTIRAVGCVTNGLACLEPGDRFFVRGPYGHGFPLSQYEGQHLIVAAGGTGLAPVKPVIKHFLGQREKLTGLDILLGFRSPGDMLFKDKIDCWQQQTKVVVTVDQPTEEWAGRVGVITTLIKELALADPGAVQVIVVGPPLMMKFSVQAFLERGIAKEQIWVSYERRMSCGLGKCGHCRINETYICLDGPVFNYSQAQWMVD